MFKTLYAKLGAILFALILFLGAFFTWLSLFISQSYFQEVSQSLNTDLAPHLVAEWNLLEGGVVNREHLEEVFHTLMVANPSIELYLLDNDGGILAYQAPEKKIKLHRVNLDPVRRFLDGEGNFPILGDDPRSLTRQKVFSASPIVINNRREGYLYVILGGEDYDSAAELLQRSYIINLSAWVGIGCLFIVLVVGLVSFGLLTRRLRRLSDAMRRFRQYEFRRPMYFPVKGDPAHSDEIDQLGHVFNEMAERIISQIEELRTIDEQRRELVGSVSHDLRAPLTALRGQLETMQLKEKSLKPEERREYLDVAVRNCHRLGRLIDDLFELAKLDAYKTRLNLEPFSMAELVQDVTSKFSAEAEMKSIRLTTSNLDDLMTVNADIGLIERALENLISNAINYTEPGGKVGVHLRRRNSSVELQVSDTGPGIPPEDIPLIFDKFYRAQSAADMQKGTGLGLAITRKIVELHDSEIKVESVLGSGTSFYFSLAAHKAA